MQLDVDYELDTISYHLSRLNEATDWRCERIAKFAAEVACA